MKSFGLMDDHRISQHLVLTKPPFDVSPLPWIIDLTDLMARALDVRVGLHAVSEGMFPLPPTYKLEVPQTKEFTSQVESFLDSPILVVPI